MARNKQISYFNFKETKHVLLAFIAGKIKGAQRAHVVTPIFTTITIS